MKNVLILGVQFVKMNFLTKKYQELHEVRIVNETLQFEIKEKIQ